MAKKGAQSSRWAVTVRLANGSVRYYAEGSLRQGRAEWTPRSNQAHHFESEEAAASFAAARDVNRNAREYAVISVGI